MKRLYILEIHKLWEFLFWNWHMEFRIDRVIVVPSVILITELQADQPS